MKFHDSEDTLKQHKKRLAASGGALDGSGAPLEALVAATQTFEVQIPSWGMGVGGTRFGRFGQPGMPTTLEEKLDDIAVLNRLCGGAAAAVSLHIPWDEPKDAAAFRASLAERNLRVGSVNSNTFQDQPGQKLSYRFGSLCHVDERTRRQAIAHNEHVIAVGKELGATSLTVWIADGSNYPGQIHSRRAFERYIDACRAIHAALPERWKMSLEHKPFEPASHHSVNLDWGASYLAASQVGDRCMCLVDFGHTPALYPLDVVVAMLVQARRLGGFHFNDKRWADDDLTAGSVAPYQLFLVMVELVMASKDATVSGFAPEYMIDQSEMIKDPLEALAQTVDALQVAWAQAHLVDYAALFAAQEHNDVIQAERALQRAFRFDVQPIVAEARLRRGGVADPIAALRTSNYRRAMAEVRTPISSKAGAI